MWHPGRAAHHHHQARRMPYKDGMAVILPHNPATQRNNIEEKTFDQAGDPAHTTRRQTSRP